MNAMQFLSPAFIYYGENAIEKAMDNIAALGKNALIVTGNSAIKLGHIDNITNSLGKLGIKTAIYVRSNSEPTDEQIYEGVRVYKENNCDFIITIGGGSALDAAKAIGLLITNSGDISDYMGLGKVKRPIPPLVAVPTTAGTGSEATQYTIITDTKSDVKMLIGSPYLIPTIAVVDPLYTMSVPASVTAATGIDALTHSIEGYTSVKNQPLTDNLALSSIRRISKYLRRACENGDDIEARTELIIAALEAGLVINNSSVTIVHGMSRPIGALFHVSHGVSNAILLPDCFDFAKDGNIDRFADVARAMEVNGNYLTNKEVAEAAVNEIKTLCKDINIPNLVDLGIDKDEFLSKVDKMSDDALASGSPNNTYLKPNKKDIINIYKKLL